MSMHFTKQEKNYRLAKKVCLGIFTVALVGFVGIKMYPLFHGPDIHIDTLSDGATLNEPMIRISGKARFTKDLLVNGTVLPTSPDGSFDEKLILTPGYNIIAVSGTDRFGTKKATTYSVVLHEEKNQTFTMASYLKTN